MADFPSDIHPTSIEGFTRKVILPTASGTGIRIALRKSKPFREIGLSMDIREHSEFDIVVDFWEEHYPHNQFNWTNSDIGITSQPFFFDSLLRSQPHGLDLINYGFGIKAAAPLIYSAPANNDLPFTPDWGYQVDQDKVILLSDSSSKGRKARPRSLPRRGFKLRFDDRDFLTEFLTSENFWAYHYPAKVINLNTDLKNMDLHIDGNFYITSDIKWTVNSVSSAYEFDILEV